MPRILALTVFVASALAFAAPATALPLLPQSFAGWTQIPAKDGPPAPSPADAAVLQEYGLAEHESAIYGNGNSSLFVRVWEFKDATGAYGAFTFLPGARDACGEYRSRRRCSRRPLRLLGRDHRCRRHIRPPVPRMRRSLSQPSRARFRTVGGAAGIPPSLPRYLPPAQLDTTSVRYAIGPAAWARMGSQIPMSAIDFSQDTEVVTAQYGAQYEPQASRNTLTLLLYPTPQIAGAHLKALDTLAKSNGFATKRAGPLVAIVSGDSRRAKQLLGAVRFSDYVTINHPEGYVPEGAKLYRLLVGITMLVVVLVSAALLLGLFLGGGRALIRILRGKPVSTVTEEEFISLHLGG
jgi:hypothetical protein